MRVTLEITKLRLFLILATLILLTSIVIVVAQNPSEFGHDGNDLDFGGITIENGVITFSDGTTQVSAGSIGGCELRTANGIAEAHVTCPSSRTLTGGGGACSGGVLSSCPTESGSSVCVGSNQNPITANGWRATCNPGASANAYVICCS